MSFQKHCLLGAALVYVIAAWFGVGYFGVDEFQHVILYAEYFRGHVGVDQLPLDYFSHWSGMVQPLICTGVFDLLGLVGISDPFLLTLALRLLTAALALWATSGFILAVLPRLDPKHARAFTLLSWFLWFLPVLQIRFTGEAWSGLLFLRGLSLLLDPRGRSPLAIGAWFGAAVLFRPAAALLPFGALLWIILTKQRSPTAILKIVAGGAFLIALGILTDSLAYGTPVFTLWNYTKSALGGEAAWRFTTLPWYYYVLFIFKYALPPIGALVLAALGILVFRKPMHPLVWILVPFLVIISILPIKEIRFLFPLAPLVPWSLIAAWETLEDKGIRMPARWLINGTAVILIALNGIALFVGACTPSGNGRIKLAQEIRDRYGDRPVHIDIRGDWRMQIPPFFLAPGSTTTFNTAACPVDTTVIEQDPPLIIIAHQSLEGNSRLMPHTMAAALPHWSHPFMQWYALEDDYQPLVAFGP